IAATHIAILDPNPVVHGRGVAKLRAAGIRVEVGEGKEEAGDLIAAHGIFITQNRPHVTLLLHTHESVSALFTEGVDEMLAPNQPEVSDTAAFLRERYGTRGIASIGVADSSPISAQLLREGLVDRIVAGPDTVDPPGFRLRSASDVPAPYVILMRAPYPERT